MAITSANQLELLQTAEAVAREKMIDPSLVVEAMEESLARAAKSRYGAEMDIRVSIDRKTGRATFTRVRTVVTDDEVENYQAEMTVEQAKQYMENPEVGQQYIEEIPPVDMGRIAAQSAKQVILQKVREAERDRQYEEFQDRAGTIINGVVEREEYGNVVVDVGRGEAILRRTEKIGRESYRPNDRIRCYIKDVRRETRGPQIFLSRTDPMFMAELFKMEVPEIYEGVIKVKSVARDPGSRAKISIYTEDSTIDPVGACVGMKGSRIHGIVRELGNENIDVINYTNNLQLFITRALNPARINSMKIDEDNKRVEVILNPEEVSKAIGRGGHNIRLAGQLTGYEIDVFREGVEEDVELTEFVDEIEGWIIDELKSIGCDTARDVIKLDVADLVKRTDLEEETVSEVLGILKAELE